MKKLKTKIKAGGYSQLPDEIKNYLKFIEQQIKCRIEIISFGPDRADTISAISYLNANNFLYIY